MDVIWQACIRGTVVVLSLMVVRIVVGRFVPRRAVVVGWWLAALSFLTPFDAGWVANESHGIAAVPLLAEVGKTEGLASVSAVASEVRDALPVPREAWGIVWMLGSCLCLAILAYIFLLQARRIHRGFAAAGNDLTMSLAIRHVRVMPSAAVTSPLTYGTLRPVIVVPLSFQSLPTRSREIMLAHEIAHVRRGDFLLKSLLAFAACAHWFNPIAWAMLIIASRDIEVACDESALRGKERRTRAEYARLLLSARQHRSRAMALTLAFGRSMLEARVNAITAATPHALASALAVALTFSAPVSALAGSTAMLSAGDHVATLDDYTLELPDHWRGRVAVETDGNRLRVSVRGYPELVLVVAEVLENGKPIPVDPSGGNPVVVYQPLPDGRHVVVHATNYVDMSAGNSWRDARTAEPSYPGLAGEMTAIDLATGGALSAEELWSRDVVYVPDVSDDALSFYMNALNGSVSPKEPAVN